MVATFFFLIIRNSFRCCRRQDLLIWSEKKKIFFFFHLIPDILTAGTQVSQEVPILHEGQFGFFF